LLNKRLWLVLALCLLMGGGFVAWYAVQNSALQSGDATTTQEIDIAPGSTLRSALNLLESRGLIRDARKLEYYLRTKPQIRAEIKAGRYRIEPGQSPLAILEQLTAGRVVLEHLTIVEGWSFAQMRSLIDRNPQIDHTLNGRSDGQIMTALGQPGLAAEGRFAADTYSFAPGTPDLQIYRLAFEAQARQLRSAWESRQKDLPIVSENEALTLASIVEKETGLASERARIAGVFTNRLRRKMPLQSDPTVIYGIRDRYDGNIRRSDLTTDTPYNTYTRTGLPPTPISLPGKDAIVAVLHPEKTDALFFVAIGDGSGGSYFSATVSEHNAAVRRYLDRLRRDPPIQSAPGTP
jgi:UPF0755 protein